MPWAVVQGDELIEQVRRDFALYIVTDNFIVRVGLVYFRRQDDFELIWSSK